MYALLVSSVILGVGASLINIVTKQVILATVGRDSQFAYYAADAGAKCGAFWNASPINVFGLISIEGEIREIIPPDFGADDSGLFDEENAILCGGQYRDVATDDDVVRIESNFQIDFERSCALVQVVKDASDNSVRIISNGYNTECSDIDNDRRIERTVIIEF